MMASSSKKEQEMDTTAVTVTVAPQSKNATRNDKSKNNRMLLSVAPLSLSLSRASKDDDDATPRALPIAVSLDDEEEPPPAAAHNHDGGVVEQQHQPHQHEHEARQASSNNNDEAAAAFVERLPFDPSRPRPKSQDQLPKNNEDDGYDNEAAQDAFHSEEFSAAMQVIHKGVTRYNSSSSAPSTCLEPDALEIAGKFTALRATGEAAASNVAPVMSASAQALVSFVPPPTDPPETSNIFERNIHMSSPLFGTGTTGGTGKDVPCSWGADLRMKPRQANNSLVPNNVVPTETDTATTTITRDDSDPPRADFQSPRSRSRDGRSLSVSRSRRAVSSKMSPHQRIQVVLMQGSKRQHERRSKQGHVSAGSARGGPQEDLDRPVPVPRRRIVRLLPPIVRAAAVAVPGSGVHVVSPTASISTSPEGPNAPRPKKTRTATKPTRAQVPFCFLTPSHSHSATTTVVNTTNTNDINHASALSSTVNVGQDFTLLHNGETPTTSNVSTLLSKVVAQSSMSTGGNTPNLGACTSSRAVAVAGETPTTSNVSTLLSKVVAQSSMSTGDGDNPNPGAGTPSRAPVAVGVVGKPNVKAKQTKQTKKASFHKHHAGPSDATTTTAASLKLPPHPLTLHRAIAKHAPLEVIRCLLSLNPPSAILPVKMNMNDHSQQEANSQQKVLPMTALQRAVECRCSVEVVKEISQVASQVKRERTNSSMAGTSDNATTKQDAPALPPPPEEIKLLSNRLTKRSGGSFGDTQHKLSFDDEEAQVCSGSTALLNEPSIITSVLSSASLSLVGNGNAFSSKDDAASHLNHDQEYSSANSLFVTATENESVSFPSAARRRTTSKNDVDIPFVSPLSPPTLINSNRPVPAPVIIPTCVQAIPSGGELDMITKAKKDPPAEQANEKVSPVNAAVTKEAIQPSSTQSTDVVEEELSNLKKLAFFIYRTQKKNVTDYTKVHDAVLHQLTEEQQTAHAELQARLRKSLRKLEVQSAQRLHVSMMHQLGSVKSWLAEDGCAPIQNHVDQVDAHVKHALHSVDSHLVRLGTDARRAQRDARTCAVRLQRRVKELEEQLDHVMEWQVDVVRRLSLQQNAPQPPLGATHLTQSFCVTAPAAMQTGLSAMGSTESDASLFAPFTIVGCNPFRNQHNHNTNTAERTTIPSEDPCHTAFWHEGWISQDSVSTISAGVGGNNDTFMDVNANANDTEALFIPWEQAFQPRPSNTNITNNITNTSYPRSGGLLDRNWSAFAASNTPSDSNADSSFFSLVQDETQESWAWDLGGDVRQRASPLSLRHEVGGFGYIVDPFMPGAFRNHDIMSSSSLTPSSGDLDLCSVGRNIKGGGATMKCLFPLKPPKPVRYLAICVSDGFQSCRTFCRLRREGFRKVSMCA
jgi:hypothetical protein